MENQIIVRSIAEIQSDSETKTILDAATDLKSRADKLVIKDDADNRAAGEILIDARTLDREVERRRKFFVDPYNKYAKMINDHFRPAGTALAGAISHLSAAMVEYDAEKNAAAEAAKKKILADGRTTAETKSEKLAAVPTPEKTVRTESGAVSFRIDNVLEIYDREQIPREYLTPLTANITDALKAGKEVPGCRLVERKVPVSRSRF